MPDNILNTPLCKLLGCEYPIIQTAMGWVADPNLVAANSNAGAIGFLAGAVMKPEEVDAALHEIKSKTDRPFGLNLHFFQPGADDIVDIAIAHRVRAVSYGRGPSSQMIEKLKAAGIVCIPTVGALKHAIKAVQLGADAVVVQGSEGGGHTGSVASTVLLPQVVDAVDVPVVAAGGFRDGRGLIAALAYGAAGIAMGTRFLMTKESPVPDITKARYASARTEEIIVSNKLDGLPQRMILNPALDKIEHSSAPGMLLRAIRNGLAYRKYTGATLYSLLKSAWNMRRSNGLTIGQTMMAANAPMMIQEAMVRGHPEQGILPSGQVAGAINDLPSCQELILQIIQEAEQRLIALRGDTF